MEKFYANDVELNFRHIQELNERVLFISVPK